MAVDQRNRNVSWGVGDEKTGRIRSWECAAVAVLMDIRDELQQLNALLSCRNFTGIPETLRGIERNTTRKTPTPRKAKG